MNDSLSTPTRIGISINQKIIIIKVKNLLFFIKN